jgi:murein DD-endopeptidase MepM/ murein hydrolase activator NlpD
MRSRRRRFLREETVAPWLTLLIIVALWWVGARLIAPNTPPSADSAPAAGTRTDGTHVGRDRAADGELRETDAPSALDSPDAPTDAALASADAGGDPLVPVAGVDAASLKSTFNEARGGGARRHEAMDILAPRGTPVVASVDGRIVKLFTSAAGGLTVYQFDEDERYCYYYAHLDSYAADLSEGQHVRRGQIIGYVGTTGNAPPDTPHLHFAITRLGPDKRWWEGEALDPITFLR